jgi:hypothetical protein
MTFHVREVRKMNLSKDTYQVNAQNKILEGWRIFINSIKESLDSLERGIDEADAMTDLCTPEWRIANEHLMDELNNRIFSISEPSWSSDDDTRRLKALKRKLHDVYARYRAVSNRQEKKLL